MHRRSRTRSLILTLIAFLAAPPLLAAPESGDWPQFRGVHRDGISPATGLLKSWTEAEPKELWRQPLGEGYSAVSVADGRLYTMYATTEGEQKLEFAAAFQASDGKELWRTKIGEQLDTEFGNGPRSTPLVDGETVYVLGSHGNFAALNTADGTPRWNFQLTETFGSSRPYWGFSTSAVLEGDLLILEGGGPEGKSYSGIDKKTGDVKWTSGEGGPGYNSPLPIDLHGQRQFVYIAGGLLRSIDAQGNELWSHPWPRGETHAMPVFIAPDKIFASGVEAVGAALYQVSQEGEGWKVEELWRDRVMRNHFSSSLLHDDHLYGFDNATLKCIDPLTGEMKWGKRGFGKGSLIYADGHLLVLSDRGVLALVEASPEAYVEKGRFQALDGRTWTAPVVAGNRLYLRDHTQLVSYDLTTATDTDTATATATDTDTDTDTDTEEGN